MVDRGESPYTLDRGSHVASLRYLDAGGPFAAALRSCALALPDTLRCIVTSPDTGSPEVVAWRSPSEAVWICQSSERLAVVHRALSGLDTGCLVDQTQGRGLIRLRGSETGLLTSLGSGFAELVVGAVRIGRIGQIAVFVCRPNAGETLLVVDRLYLEHLVEHLDRAASSQDFTSLSRQLLAGSDHRKAPMAT